MHALRFLHIPKTAGTTLRDVLKRIYWPRRRFEFSGEADVDLARFHALSEATRANIALYMGHAPIETGIGWADQCVTITVLRDPVSRVRSFCQHVAEGKSPYLRAAFPPENFDLDKFLWSGNLELSNLQTKMLVNRRICDAPLPAHLSESGCIQLAIDNLLHRVACFGIQEQFDESMTRFGSLLNRRMAGYTARNQADPQQPLLFQQRHLQRIADLNTLDLEVYREAVAHFQRIRSRESAVSRPTTKAGEVGA
jgi:hypothetical protein